MGIVIVCRHGRENLCVDCAEDQAERYRQFCEWVAKGWCNGEKEPECKTIGNLHEEIYGSGHHCLSCWMYEAKRRAKGLLEDAE